MLILESGKEFPQIRNVEAEIAETRMNAAYGRLKQINYKSAFYQYENLIVLGMLFSMTLDRLSHLFIKVEAQTEEELLYRLKDYSEEYYIVMDVKNKYEGVSFHLLPLKDSQLSPSQTGAVREHIIDNILKNI